MTDEIVADFLNVVMTVASFCGERYPNVRVYPC